MIEGGTNSEHVTSVFDLTHDFAVLDRYQAFSAELIRLALAGITAGAIFAAWAIDTQRNVAGGTKVLLCTALLFFGVAAAAALGHRYWSTDSMTIYIAMRRANAKATGTADGLLPGEANGPRSRTLAEAKYLRDKTARDLAFRYSTATLAISSSSLVLGAIAAGVAVVRAF